MTARADDLRSGTARPASAWSRVYGFGSVYAKSLRDSRLAFLVMAGLLGGVMLAVGSAIPTVFPTEASRAQVVRLANDLGTVASGIAGRPVNVGTLGGYIQWKYGPVFAIIAALWSILALSGALATEARRGSLELVAVAPLGKRRIAVEKLAAHLTVMVVLVVILAVAAWLAAAAFGTLPGDAIPVAAAVGYALWVGLMALAFGGLAFSLAQLFGRGPGAGIAGALLFVGWIMNGYAVSIPALAAVAELTPWGWTANHLPLAGETDWLSLLPVALAAAVLLAAGVELFVRRDLGATISIPTPHLPTVALGVKGPIGRSFGDRLPVALSWGIGVGLFGLVMAAVSRTIADEVAKAPDLAQTFHSIFPTFDATSAGGFLQLLVQLMFIVVGFAAVTLVAGWASDETSGRLELLLSTPLDRAGWAMRSAVGVLVAIAVMTLVMATLVAFGAASAGSDIARPALGTLSLGLYAAALAGIGFAAGGIRASIAAEVVAIVVIATYLVDLLAPALKLPDWVHQLALTAHMGQPMVGIWDWAGIAACAVLAIGGLVVGGLAVRRRDIGR
ncbi:MAG TPA: hypothetical protein VFI28_09810 [Candidatus Limnocylindrales bacterium]|nr:hypothetical protein [Candidatus Limnocylindrales bacterium]